MDSAKLKAYYNLTKPGIVRGNVLAALAGYLFACAWHVNWIVLFATLAGTGLVIASSCVINNYIDRHIDARMERTSKRALVSGQISARNALLYATALSVVGFVVLISWTNWLVVLAGAIGMFSYLVIYGWGKRHTVHGTLLGTISGSMPLVAGYVAYVDKLDITALMLVAIMTTWQMAHFFSIGIYRAQDYRASNLPILPIVRGTYAAQRQVLAYIGILIACCVGLTSLGYAGFVLLLVMVPLCVRWLWTGFVISGDAVRWGRAMFGQSLVVLLTLLTVLSLGKILP
jgi:protoheme IX farnesyltransferase